MKKQGILVRVLATAIVMALGTSGSYAGKQDAIDGCIDQLRRVGGPDGQAGGVVLRSDFSQAGTLVILRDAGGTVWRCLAYSDGTVGDFSVAQAADDGGGAMAGAPKDPVREPTTQTRRVRFDGGSTGTELVGRLSPGSSIRYVVGARNGQFLYARVATSAPRISYQIFNPDRSFLLGQMTSAKEYRGQLWQSGDHVIEVINRGSKNAAYNIIIGVQ